MLFDLKKSLGLEKTGLGLTLWNIGLGLDKYSNYLTARGLILRCIGTGLEKCSTTLLDLDLLYDTLVLTTKILGLP